MTAPLATALRPSRRAQKADAAADAARAGDGGAIAFSTPGVDGLRVEERWLPHLGDVLAFAVEATLWRAIELVHGGDRLTLTGQDLAGRATRPLA